MAILPRGALRKRRGQRRTSRLKWMTNAGQTGERQGRVGRRIGKRGCRERRERVERERERERERGRERVGGGLAETRERETVLEKVQSRQYSLVAGIFALVPSETSLRFFTSPRVAPYSLPTPNPPSPPRRDALDFLARRLLYPRADEPPSPAATTVLGRPV